MIFLQNIWIYVRQVFWRACQCAVCVSCLLCLCSSTVWGQNAVSDSVPLAVEDTVRRELWTGSLYSSTYKVGLCISPTNTVRGVLHLRLKNGQVDVYHFYGHINEKGVITVTHNDGHRFEGYFKDARTVLGKITLRNGFSMKLSGERMRDASLTKSCGPLPE